MKVFYCLIYLCLITIAVSIQPKIPRETNMDFEMNYFEKTLNSFIESLKNPIGPNVNSNNRCVWKICSKPLKGKYRTPSYKDIIIHEKFDKELSGVIKINIRKLMKTIKL